MPIWLRNFTFNTLKKHYDTENEKIQKQTLQNETKQQINKPDIQPTYTTKAPKK